jgi:hypothetical protein
VKVRLVGVAVVASMTCAAVAGAQPEPAAQAVPGRVALGDWQFTPVLEARARGEYRHDVNGEDNGLLVERARVGVDAVKGPLEARVVLQDAHTLDLTPGGEIIGGPSPVAVTGAYEAWAEAHTDGIRPSFLRVGRQPIVWGEGRLLGIADWSPTARSLDAIRGRLVIGDGAVEVLAAALTDTAEGVSLEAYGELAGARFEWAFDPLLSVEVFALARVAQTEPVASLGGSVRGQTYTGSARLHGDSYVWAWSAEGALQLGHADDLAADRRAWAAAGYVGRAFERVALAPAVRLGLSYASGDRGGATYGSFDPLLPDVHTWHGAMDLFAWSNEAEVNARATIVPAYGTTLLLEYRYARLAQPGAPWRTAYLTTIGSASGNSNPDLGHELDAAFAWSPWAPVDLEVGYSVLILGGGARAILEANALADVHSTGLNAATVSHFAYAQAGFRLY